MKPFYQDQDRTVYAGDNRLVLPLLPSDFYDSCVTDPPAGIGFMNKEWDKAKGGRDSWIAWMAEVMKEVKRTLKPGAHALVWALPRTSHWTATALEDAGFEIRDIVNHLFGTGFPKSLDVSKAIDKMKGAERDVIGQKNIGLGNRRGNGFRHAGDGEGVPVTLPATEDAARWQGWGTALKPAVEHWILCRKPLSETSVAGNVIEHGTGALNIDGCRIETGESLSSGRHIQAARTYPSGYKDTHRTEYQQSSLGRWPANLILDDYTAELLDEQSGQLTSGTGAVKRVTSAGYQSNAYGKESRAIGTPNVEYGDTGGASRYFYVAKPSRAERNEGLEDRSRVNVNDGRKTSIDNPFQRGDTPRQNTHPTVKPIELMRYLVRLVTPEGGTVLDPFMGSGTTGIACEIEARNFVGIELDETYCDIAVKRMTARCLPLMLNVAP